jgi:hypothetical protein
LIRPGDRAVDLRWCGTPPGLERGSWLPADADAYPKGAGMLPFRFEGGVVSIGGVIVRSTFHERARLLPSRRYLFTYAKDSVTPNPWAGPVWAVAADGRVAAAVGNLDGRLWMRCLIGQDARAVVDRLKHGRPSP